MRSLAILTGVFAGLATHAVADPSYLMAPDDPANRSGWRPPPPITAGLESFAPVDAKDWLKSNSSAASGGSMGGMKGMDGGMNGMPGMKTMEGMPGMGGPSKGGMKDMPGMGGGK